jgi:hypothetical protein
MIHSAVSECKQLVLIDNQPLHMAKFVGAVRNFSENTTNVKINVEDNTGLVRVILWRKEKECTAKHWLIHTCNGNCYFCVIGEVEDYYGVYEIIAFDVGPVSSGDKVTHHFLEVAYSFEMKKSHSLPSLSTKINLSIHSKSSWCSDQFGTRQKIDDQCLLF